MRSNRDILATCVLENEYWSRAWITQEVELVRQVTVWLDVQCIDFKELIEGLEYFYLTAPANLRIPFSRIVRRWREESPLDRLVVFLTDFRGKRCYNPLDRIYSVLSLCADEGMRPDNRLRYHRNGSRRQSITSM